MEESGLSSSQPRSVPPKDEKRGNKDRGQKAKVNKRTKTGCLTCRRRRIKCDEGRPICLKCAKSKRTCEGYNQRHSNFKEYYGTYPSVAHGPAVYPPGSSIEVSHQGVAGSSTQGVLQAIAPKPPSHGFGQHQQGHPLNLSQAQETFIPQIPQIPETTTEDFLLQLNTNHPATSFADHSQEPQPSPEVFYDPTSYGYQPHPSPLVLPNLTSTFNRFSPAPPTLHFGGANQAFASPSPLSGTAASGQFSRSSFQRVDGDSTMRASDDEGSSEDDMAASDDGEPDVEKFVLTINSARESIKNLPYQQMPRHEDELLYHFVHVTGPSISMYERVPCEDVATEQLCSQPYELGPNLWSHTFPLLSMGHPALRRAILALAGLQVAKLRGFKPVLGFKQYEIAIRRLQRNAGNSERIVQPATLAASLLLAYFDVWKADHGKWCSHLFAARIIFSCLDLRAMSQKCLPAKLMRQKQREAETGFPSGSFFPTGSPNIMSTGGAQYISFDFLSVVTGTPLAAENYGVGPHQISHESIFRVSEQEIKTYENFRDLFWWYCKMDVYQSILGATKLFMKYEHWTQCPPRAPMNRTDAIYGTYDHIVLLLGRLANFHERDMARKRESQKPEDKQGPSPPFMGMLPANSVQAWPTGWPSAGEMPGRIQETAEERLTTGDDALREWKEISHAFSAFSNELGREFQSVEGEFSKHWSTPFGPALQYPTFAIAGIWMNYYMGMIILVRTHPTMPPAAALAIRAAAEKTTFYANMIGCIAGGLVNNCSKIQAHDVPICAALVESAFCLFVAGIQFNSQVQREWIVQRMHDIARVTGWQSAQQIADGCESAWIKSHELGVGPPHKPSNLNARSSKTVMQAPRRLDEAINSQVPVETVERAHYALGLLEVEDDFSKLNLRDPT